MGCLGEETILGFIEGRLDRDGLVRVETHARECQSCDELIAAAFSQPDRASATRDRIERGTRIGRYTVVDLVGAGGMSEVYSAHDPELDRMIALKVMRPRWSAHGTRDTRHEHRLAQEAQATARLRHPNVISVHDVGTFGARVFIAMEYVDGQTLSAWLREKRRSWREILAVFVAAARGLSAAHAAGVVHRDFKPQNVMVGRDGLVQVMDFGLATRIDAGSAAGSTNDQGSPISSPNDGRSFGAGEIVGTPPFMAPEQRRGEAADARSDQFSFCVALYQALYGEHPFVNGRVASESPVTIAVGRLKGPSARSTVPAWLRRAVTRGLARSREDRWPSMDSLVSALARHPTAARRRVMLAIGPALACVLVAVTVLGRPWRQEPRPCLEGSRRLADAWSISRDPQSSSPRRASVLAAFRASKVAGATETWDRVSALLDRYANQWSVMYRDACEEKDIRHDQSSDLTDLRMACLEDSHAALESLTGLLATADGGAITNAVDAVHTLPALDRCAAVSLQHAMGAPKASAEVASRAAEIRRRAMAAREAFDTGDYKRAIEREEPLLAEARRLGYAPLVAEMLLMVGSQESLTFQPNATARLREAVGLAVRVRRDDIAAEGYVVLGGSAVVLGHLDEAQIWLDLGEAVLDRMGESQVRLRSWLMNDRAIASATSGQYAEARRLYDQALVLKRKIYPADHPDIVRTMVSQAENLHLMGRDQEALKLNTQALRSFEAIYGAQSPFVALCVSNRGEYQMAIGAQSEALSSFRRALALWEGSVGPDHPVLAYPLTGLGRALLGLGGTGEALVSLERAARLREIDDVNPALKAETAFALAQALWATGQRARARRLAAAAEVGYRRGAGRRREAEEAQSWLSRHRAAARSSPGHHRRSPGA